MVSVFETYFEFHILTPGCIQSAIDYYPEFIGIEEFFNIKSCKFAIEDILAIDLPTRKKVIAIMTTRLPEDIGKWIPNEVRSFILKNAKTRIEKHHLIRVWLWIMNEWECEHCDPKYNLIRCKGELIRSVQSLKEERWSLVNQDQYNTLNTGIRAK